jgi:hypothetical protein
MFLRLTVPAMLLAAAAPASAADPAPKDSALLQGLRSCQQIQDSAARLACFDKAAAALVGAAAQGDVAVVDREQVRKARRSLFGFALPEFPFLSGSKDEKDQEPKELVTKLASFRSLGAGRYAFVVEDGNATWETTESAQFGDVDQGDKVTIQRGGFLGSFFAQIGNGRWVRVRRVR